MNNHPGINQLRTQACLSIAGGFAMTVTVEHGTRVSTFAKGRLIKSDVSGDLWELNPMEVIEELDRVGIR